jgi:hypothetical protein
MYTNFNESRKEKNDEKTDDYLECDEYLDPPYNTPINYFSSKKRRRIMTNDNDDITCNYRYYFMPYRNLLEFIRFYADN